MPNPIRLTDELAIDVKEHLRSAEQLLDRLARDANIRKDFATSPAKVLREFGFVLEEGGRSLSTTNRIFFSIVTNKALVRWVRQNEPKTPTPAEVTSAVRKWAKGEASLTMPEKYFVDMSNSILSNEDFIRRLARRLGRDPAVRAALPGDVTASKLESYLIETRERIKLGATLEELKEGRQFAMAVLGLLLIAIVVIAVAVVVDKHDGMVPSDPRDKNYDLIRNLWLFSNELSKIQP